ncbi:hypothetical protein SH584_08565 [Sphingomonas sp. LY29]|uniref:hypothetical protein n=1 Tax=Sphingomonas sp. LY29 TaxID=3095341 RepID=UPI002D7A20BC|nr:hypothetical protein [Sphingomonas sp. LY29]WRP25102.1 hypothetical protein SH584_08565 [Sphingomonas sp. LY29]
MIRATISLLALTALAACQQEAAAPPPAKDIVVRSAAQKQLFELSDLNRTIALKRAISGQGLSCPQLVTSGFSTRYKDMDMWTATCSDKRQWALFIGANDTVQVRPCKDNAQFDLPPCTIKPGTEGGTGLDEVNLVNSDA